jgi:uncharacterized protein involved in exopolysaccharide biosynthesis
MDVYANSLPLSKDVARTISLSGMLTLLRRNIWSIISYAIVISLAVFAITVTMPKTYTATGALIVEGDRFSIPEIDGALRDANTPDPMPKVRSEAQAIRSRQLLQGVIDSLDLAKDPEFNPSLYSSSPLAEARRALSLVLGSRTTPEEINQAVLDSVMRSLTVFQDNRSLVIDISFTSRDPELSAAFINTLIQHYTDGLAEARAKASRAANAVLWQQLNQTQVEIDGLEARIRRLRIDTGLVSLPAGSVGQQQLEELSVAAARAGVERARVETTWNQAKALTQENRPEELASVLESPTIARLRPLEAAAAQRLADLTARYGPRYVGLEGVRADLNAARQQVAEEARRIVASLGLQVEVARAGANRHSRPIEFAT